MRRLLSRKAIQLTVAYLIVLFGLALITIAFFVPPRGVIDPTVLTAFGEILTFSGSLIGIDYHYRFKDFLREPFDVAQEAPQDKLGSPTEQQD